MGIRRADTARALGDALAAALSRHGARCSSPAPTCRITTTPRPRSALDAVVIDRVARFDRRRAAGALDRNDRIMPAAADPMVAVMRAAQALGARDAVVLNYADSGDVSGDKSSVVGYLAAASGDLQQ